MFDPMKHTQSKQTEKDRADQVKNNAGGFVFALDCFAQLERFLILGSEGGTYYATERDVTRDSLTCLDACLKEHGVRTVNMIMDVSESGRAPKNSYAVFALAYAAKRGDDRTRKAAFAALPHVARIGTDLFAWAEYVNKLGGWGRGTRNAIANWYRSQKNLSLQLVKYQQRNGWSHRDLLRLAHVNPTPMERINANALGWAAGKEVSKLPPLIEGFEAIKQAPNDLAAAILIKGFKLPRECVPTQFLNSRTVWEALLEIGMGYWALVRNLGKMSSLGMLDPFSEGAKEVRRRLSDAEQLQRSKLHPMKILIAYLQYKRGRGVKGALCWNANQQIVDALEEAFYTSFGHITPTGQNFLLSLDVSGSMTGGSVAGVEGLTPNVAAACMAMVAARSEKEHAIFGFADSYRDLGITAKSSLSEAIVKTQSQSFGRTDCSLPMQIATKLNYAVDVFCVYTDNETYAGSIHPYKALQQHREKTGRASKLAVFGMTSTGFSIADPQDAGMMDFVGFDAAAPEVLGDFARRKLR